MSKANRRFYRTLLLGVAALGTLIWSAIEQFGISQQEMVNLLVGTVIVAAGTIVLAGVCVGLWFGLRKLLGPRDEK